MRLLSFLFACLSFSCGKQVPTDDPPHQPDDSLEHRLALYQSLLREHRSPHGFVYTDECDSLLFSSLSSFHETIDIWSAYDQQTRMWHRTPAKDCYANHVANQEHADDPAWQKLTPTSQSTISRDMLLGLLWYAYMHRDLAIAESVYTRAIEHKMQMGDGLPSRTLMSGSMLATVAQLIHKLGGKDHAERHFPVRFLPGKTGFEAHIETWHILLRMRLYDTIDDSAPKRLSEHAARQPDNALYQYAVGNIERTVELLKDERHFPVDRLPSSREHCARWLYERESDSDSWLPCDDERTHAGGELLSIGYLLTKGL